MLALAYLIYNKQLVLLILLGHLQLRVGWHHFLNNILFVCEPSVEFSHSTYCDLLEDFIFFCALYFEQRGFTSHCTLIPVQRHFVINTNVLVSISYQHIVCLISLKWECTLSCQGKAEVRWKIILAFQKMIAVFCQSLGSLLYFLINHGFGSSPMSQLP